ncbi:MAG: LCP family protein [Clostridia bacterium]|nr:LCP family protein [Clostridia bacterium]
MSKFYYSVAEKDEKLKLLRKILCLCLAVVFLIGVIYTVVYVNSIQKEKTPSSQISKSEVLNTTTLICIEDEDNEDILPRFLLVKFNSGKKEVLLSEVPNDLIIENNLGVMSIYKSDGAGLLRDKISSAYGVEIKRYFKYSLAETEVLVDKIGGVDYDVDKPMQFKNKEGNLVTNLVKGRQKLNGNQYCQYMRFGDWSNDAQGRKNREALTIALLNEHIKDFESDRILEIYKKISNNVTTDASIVEINNFSLLFAEIIKENAPVKRANVDYSNKESVKKIY